MTTAAIAINVAIALPFVKPLGVTVMNTARIAFHLKDETHQGVAIRNTAALGCVWQVAIAAAIFAHQII